MSATITPPILSRRPFGAPTFAEAGFNHERNTTARENNTGSVRLRRAPVGALWFCGRLFHGGRLPFAAILTVGIIVCSAAVQAFDVPPLTGRVVDTARLLSDADRATIEKAIVAFEKATSGQMAVLTLTTLNDEPIENVGIKTAEAWKIGRKGQDNGAILLIAVQDRKMRLEIGYGWEGAINDARAGDIIRGMAPYFRKSDFKGGILHAVHRVQALVTGAEEKEQVPPPKKTIKARSNLVVSILFALFIICIFIGPFLARHGGRTYGHSSRGYRSSYGGFGGGGFSSGGGSGGGFSGGGGSFGGGGASGNW